MTYPQHFIANAALSLFIFFTVSKGAYCNVDLHSKASEGRSAESVSFTYEEECIAPGLCSGGSDALEGEEEWKGHSEARMGLLGLFESLGVTRKRRKRSKDNKQITGFSLSERRAIVKRHNELRQSVRPPAADMLTMSWNTELEQLASSYAAKCNFEHNPNRKTASFPSVGENLFAHSSGYNETAIVQAWYNEEKDYDYNSNTCSKVCGHYTQVVWAKTNKVGCSIRYCNPLRNVKFGSGYFTVCNYAPPGNYRGQKPYQRAVRTTTKKPTTRKPTTKKPTTKRPTTKKPTTKRPTTKKPTTKKPTTKRPTTKKPTTKKPTTKKPVTPKTAPPTGDNASSGLNANFVVSAASVLFAVYASLAFC